MARLTFGPEAYGGSSWVKPGDEWGTGFIFPEAGCWGVHAQRDDLVGDLYLLGVPVVSVQKPTFSSAASKPGRVTRCLLGAVRRQPSAALPWSTVLTGGERQGRGAWC